MGDNIDSICERQASHPSVLKPRVNSVKSGPSTSSLAAEFVSPVEPLDAIHEQTQPYPEHPKSTRANSLSVIARERQANECKDFDDVIEKVASNGKYQKQLIYGAFAPISALQPILIFNAVFMLYIPDHWCTSPERKYFDDAEEYKLVNIPMINGTDGRYRYDSCSMYGPNLSVVKCTHGWEYDKTYYDNTMTSDYGWFCDKANIPTLVLLCGTLGNSIGIFIFGLLSDNWGRKPALFSAVAINVIFRFISLFCGSHWYWLCACQFLIGTTYTALYIIPSMIAAELCNKDERAEVYAITWTVCLIGLIVLPMIAWACGDWFLIGQVTAIMGCLMLLLYPFVPESPRWLLQKGRIEETAAIIHKIKSYNEKAEKKSGNGCSQTYQDRRRSTAVAAAQAEKESTLENLRGMLREVLDRQHDAEERVSMAEGRGAQLEDRSKATVLFTKRNLAKNTLMLTVCWTMNTMIYNIMAYNSTHMSGSHFKNFFLLGIIEVPSGFIGGYMADTIGRRWTQSFSFGLCGLCCFATSLLVHQRELEVLLATLAKMVVTVSFLVTYCQGTELFPTELRSTGTAIASTFGNFLSIIAPVIADLSTYNGAYPWLFMAGCSILGMIASAFLPETLNMPLPETIEEANNIGINAKFWSIQPPVKQERNRRMKKDNHHQQ